MTYLEFIEKFPDDESVAKYLIEKRFEGKIVCPFCGKTEKVYHAHYNCRNAYCNNCKMEFSIFKGTIFEETRMPLRHWLYAINMVCLSKKGISAMQLKRELGVSYKTAWRMMHKIRGAMAKREVGETFEAIVEIDETYVGGLEKNKKKSQQRGWGRGPSGKLIVVGGRSREGQVISSVVQDNKKETLHGFINENIEKGSTVMTDTWKSYNGLTNFTHHKINHSVREFVRGIVHTNGIESFWAILKRGYYGIYHYMSEKHLNRYVHEYSFRYNTSKGNVLDFLGKTIEMMDGKRLRYCDLKK